MNRRISLRTNGVCILVIFSAGIAVGQPAATKNTIFNVSPQPPTEAKSADFAWLVGYWQGSGFGGTADEMWCPAAGGSMLGTFRLVTDDQLNFSEFCMLVKVDGQWLLQVKHFGPDMKGWEPADKSETFPLLKMDAKTLWFRGITYRLDDNGILHVYVAMRQDNGSHQEQEMVMKRVKF